VSLTPPRFVEGEAGAPQPAQIESVVKELRTRVSLDQSKVAELKEQAEKDEMMANAVLTHIESFESAALRLAKLEAELIQLERVT
jgi:hypothetical protein